MTSHTPSSASRPWLVGAALAVVVLAASACGATATATPTPARARSAPPLATAASTASTANSVVTAYGFKVTPPVGATAQAIGLLSSQADATSGALNGSRGALTYVLVWNAGFHDADTALQAGFTALGVRGAAVKTGAAGPLSEGDLNAVGRTFELTTTTGSAAGFAAAWGCGQPQRTFALVVRSDPAAAQQTVRTMLASFKCQAQ